jgi:hypothetical protein
MGAEVDVGGEVQPLIKSRTSGTVPEAGRKPPCVHLRKRLHAKVEKVFGMASLYSPKVDLSASKRGRGILDFGFWIFD